MRGATADAFRTDGTDHEGWSGWWLRWSLDAPLAAVGWLLLTRRCGLDSDLAADLAAPWVLGASTWLVYAADRWADSRRLHRVGGASGSLLARPRHRLNAGPWRLPLLWVTVLVATLWASSWLTRAILLQAVFVLILAVAYLALVHLTPRRFAVPKELLVPMIFTAGVLAFVEQPERLLPWEALGLFGVAWLNCQLVSFWDRDYDLRSGQATWLGGLLELKGLATFGVAWSTLMGWGGLVGRVHPIWSAALVVAALGLVVLVCLVRPETGRRWVDLVLAMPAWALAFG